MTGHSWLAKAHRVVTPEAIAVVEDLVKKKTPRLNERKRLYNYVPWICAPCCNFFLLSSHRRFLKKSNQAHLSTAACFYPGPWTRKKEWSRRCRTGYTQKYIFLLVCMIAQSAKTFVLHVMETLYKNVGNVLLVITASRDKKDSRLSYDRPSY